MGFLALCSDPDCTGTGEPAMGVLAICGHACCTGKSAMGFLAICSHAH